MIFKSIVVVIAVLVLCLASHQIHGKPYISEELETTSYSPLVNRYRQRYQNCREGQSGCDNGHCWYECEKNVNTSSQRMFSSSASSVYTGCTSKNQC